MEHMVLKLAERPNDFPKNNIENITIAIKGPATYQGQGWLIQSNN
jgi:hypothetical protein